jgi:hypothetical protein
VGNARSLPHERHTVLEHRLQFSGNGNAMISGHVPFVCSFYFHRGTASDRRDGCVGKSERALRRAHAVTDANGRRRLLDRLACQHQAVESRGLVLPGGWPSSTAQRVRAAVCRGLRLERSNCFRAAQARRASAAGLGLQGLRSGRRRERRGLPDHELRLRDPVAGVVAVDAVVIERRGVERVPDLYRQRVTLRRQR